jgi:hypothetical protein
VHKGRAVCSAVAGIMFGCRVVWPARFWQSAAHAIRATSAIDKIPKRKTDSPAQMRGMLFLAA